MTTQAHGTFKIQSWDEQPYVEGDEGAKLTRFDGSEAKGPLTIVPGSGTGELEGIAGDGELRAPMGGQPSVSLSYRFD